jgi:hypothetical protein
MGVADDKETGDGRGGFSPERQRGAAEGEAGLLEERATVQGICGSGQGGHVCGQALWSVFNFAGVWWTKSGC